MLAVPCEQHRGDACCAILGGDLHCAEPLNTTIVRSSVSCLRQCGYGGNPLVDTLVSRSMGLFVVAAVPAVFRAPSLAATIGSERTNIVSLGGVLRRLSPSRGHTAKWAPVGLSSVPLACSTPRALSNFARPSGLPARARAPAAHSLWSLVHCSVRSLSWRDAFLVVCYAMATSIEGPTWLGRGTSVST